MNRKSTPKLIITITAVVLLLAIGVIGFLAFRQSQNGTNQNSNNTPQETPAALLPSEVTGDGFTYAKPQGWAKLSKERLDASAAISGIGLPSSDLTKLPVATLTVQVTDAAPKDDNDLKNSTIKELEKFAEFELIDYTDTTIDGKTGKKFVYKFGDDKDKTKQEMSVIVNNKKTYFILYSSSEATFDQHNEEAKSITSSFKFK